MRRRITRTLFAAAAAGVTAGTLGLSAAGAANAAVSHAAGGGTIGPRDGHPEHGGVRGKRA